MHMGALAPLDFGRARRCSWCMPSLLLCWRMDKMMLGILLALSFKTNFYEWDGMEWAEQHKQDQVATL